MTNEEIVLDSIKFKVKNRKLSPLKFKNYSPYFNDFDRCISILKNLESKEDRILEIVKLASLFFGTVYYKGESYQCRIGARRSVLDIMRIYKFYFEDIELFTVMRILNELVKKEKISTMRCWTVRKQVFWIDHGYYSAQNNYSGYENTELGIKFKDWETIGTNND